ncbi:MAG TPA: 4Fe-4S binding protein [Firmicutes bacterium]|nr:4Fe-4S binding protein [Bacillota bacterium]
MKQLLILSGKGGTGKTTMASAFVRLSKARAYADCDVDAPNLHLTVGWTKEPKRSHYFGLPRAKVDPDLCIRCDLCRQYCRFGSVILEGSNYRVDSLACEGCGVCEFVCPAGAISMEPHVDGELMLYSDAKTAFSTAKLNIGSGTSGLLVTEVKKQMRESAGTAPLAIIDGSPGIGCPVIASLSGVDLVLVVTEPSITGMNDMTRIVETARKFGTKTVVCINKCDTNMENTRCIAELCRGWGLALVGLIPFDSEVVKTVNAGLSIVDVDCQAGEAVRSVFEKTMDILFGENEGGDEQ